MNFLVTLFLKSTRIFITIANEKLSKLCSGIKGKLWLCFLLLIFPSVLAKVVKELILAVKDCLVAIKQASSFVNVLAAF